MDIIITVVCIVHLLNVPTISFGIPEFPFGIIFLLPKVLPRVFENSYSEDLLVVYSFSSGLSPTS